MKTRRSISFIGLLAAILVHTAPVSAQYDGVLKPGARVWVTSAPGGFLLQPVPQGPSGFWGHAMMEPPRAGSDPSFILGAVVGAALGGGLGFLVATALDEDCRGDPLENRRLICQDRDVLRAFGVGLGIILGGAIGAQVGASRLETLSIHKFSVAPFPAASGRGAVGLSISVSARR